MSVYSSCQQINRVSCSESISILCLTIDWSFCGMPFKSAELHVYYVWINQLKEPCNCLIQLDVNSKAIWITYPSGLEFNLIQLLVACKFWHLSQLKVEIINVQYPQVTGYYYPKFPFLIWFNCLWLANFGMYPCSNLRLSLCNIPKFSVQLFVVISTMFSVPSSPISVVSKEAA